ncbi:MAG: response regulator [Spirochaetales bacterium]|nr:response regulator [Spirochaetales bacterium]
MVKIDNIVVVEDNPDHLELTCNAIKEICPDILVLAFTNGKEAEEYLFGNMGPLKNPLRKLPDLILIDMFIPLVPGMELLKSIRTYREYQTVPVVMFSELNGARDIDRVINLGGNDFIIKPHDMNHFTEKLKALMRYWAYVSDL